MAGARTNNHNATHAESPKPPSSSGTHRSEERVAEGYKHVFADASTAGERVRAGLACSEEGALGRLADAAGVAGGAQRALEEGLVAVLRAPGDVGPEAQLAQRR